MEDERATVTNKQGKKRTSPLSTIISVGTEGGVAGILLFGGALAVAGYMAVASIASIKNRAKGKGSHDHHQPRPNKPQQLLSDECGCKSEEDHKRFTSSLQHSTTQDVDAACCWSSNMHKSINQVSPPEMVSAQTLILEKKTEHKPNSEEESPTCFHHQEIAFSDCSQPESASSSNENGVAEDCLVSLFNSPGGQEQEVQNYEHGLKSSETESEDNDINVEEDDGVLGSGEEDSSKATGCTSLDYNEEPVWPAELIQEQGPDFNGGYCDGNVCSDDCDADGSDYAENDKAMTVTNEATLKQKENFLVMLNDQPSVLKNWVIPMLLLALMLILVLLTRQESSYILDEDNSVVVP